MLLCVLLSVTGRSVDVLLFAKAYRAVWLGSYTVTMRHFTTANGPFLEFDCKFTHFAIGGDEGEAQPSGSLYFDHAVEQACSASVEVTSPLPIT